jgi:hypothetical protein
MSRLRDWFWGGIFLLMTLTASGCGDDPKVSNDLKRLGIAYHNYYDVMQKAPTGPKDLEPYYERDARLTQALDSGQYVFLWNASMRDLIQGAGPGSTVLAYEKDVPVKGGQVLMGDATIRRMTAQEFAQASKAAPPSKPKDN